MSSGASERVENTHGFLARSRRRHIAPASRHGSSAFTATFRNNIEPSVVDFDLRNAVYGSDHQCNAPVVPALRSAAAETTHRRGCAETRGHRVRGRMRGLEASGRQPARAPAKCSASRVRQSWAQAAMLQVHVAPRPRKPGGRPIQTNGNSEAAASTQLVVPAKTAAWRLANSAKVVGLTPNSSCVPSSTRDWG